ncbi:MAG TPA: peptidase C15 [Beijerinckiaceae bacterium]|nr:peptidase C15 [Beijerinckiaceae bacterium]
MSARRPRLLVTGFGPFPGMSRNPSAEIARRVATASRWRRLGVAAEALILPTTYAALADVLEPALAAAPDAVLMIGVAGRSRAVRMERQARNRASLLLPDAAGRRPQRLTLADGPAARRLGTSPERLSALLRRHGVACRVSHDAGRYLCNAAYFRALAGPVPVLFVHIPKPRARRRRAHAPRRLSWTDALAAALIESAAVTLRDGTLSRSVAGLGRAD